MINAREQFEELVCNASMSFLEEMSERIGKELVWAKEEKEVFK